MSRRHESEWTNAELTLLDANLHLPLDELAEKLNKSSVVVSRAKARLESPRLSDPWTKEDDALILATPNLTAVQVARQLGRSVASVTSRRAVLGAVKHVKFGDGSNKNPTHIGARPLLAKTCGKCGKLLTADWFSFSPVQNGKGGWQPQCRACRSAAGAGKKSSYHGSERYAEKTKESRKRLQAMTVPHASRSGEAWLDSDHAVLKDPDLTLVEKALRLKRSYNAVSIICSSNGYKSHVGLGEATDLWRIFNPNEPLFAEQVNGEQAA